MMSLFLSSLLAAAPAVEISYGTHPRQRLDLAADDEADRQPILFFIHGGGWAFGDKRQAEGEKPEFVNNLGWAYAASNYRLVPEVRVEDQATDLARALATLRDEAGKRGLDPDRIVLMGHSAGAHLAALLATDPQYLLAAGVPFEAVRGVVLLDGAGYEVSERITSQGLHQRLYRKAFGEDPKRHRALSPVHQVGGLDAPNWLIFHVARRKESRDQSQALGRSLSARGAQVKVVPLQGETHRSVNRELGLPGEQSTREVSAFLRSLD